MAYTVLPIAGVLMTSAQQTNDGVPTFGPTGAETFGSDGKRYVFASVGEDISASSPSCAINASTFVATASSGEYLSPGVALASGDYAWFSKASV